VSADAFERALEALAHRERTSGELREWLAGRGFGAGEIDATIAKLSESGGLDDERFAIRFADDKRTLRGWGPERIRAALAGRGLDAGTVERALASDGRDGQLERAIELLAARSERPTDERSRGRALAYLARRGYDSELAYDAVRTLERRAA
jgi:regulatory protein